MEITFTIPGPAVGKGRPKAARRGNFITMYTPEKTASYESMVKVLAQDAMNGEPPTKSPCTLIMTIEVSVPASWSDKKTKLALSGLIFPTTKPDLDNVLKTVCDAMNGIAYDDDKQIVYCIIRKNYSVTPKVVVHVQDT